MKRLITGVVVFCMVLGLGSMAFAQTGEVSVDQWFTNHKLETEIGSEDKFEATARLTGVKGTFDITDKIGIAGSFVFGKSDDFKDKTPKVHGELSNMGIALQYKVIPMVKAQAGFFSGGYKLPDGDEYKMSGITVGAAVDAAVGNGIGIFGEAAYAPIVTAKLDKEELKDSSMMAFEAGGKYDFGQFGVKAGYRYQGFTFKQEKEKESDSATFSGFFVGASVNF
ncbi:MAG: hypothetical protein GX322_09755 [Firmicutes bacterium]|nr:hypothetical protein [Bacillota bacterium]